jgi:uncharacterized membrane protein YkvA (DUF1232 family)
VRVRLWLLFAYLAMPFDLVPDFIPVVGYADDAILVVIVLHPVVRRAGRDAVRRHWSGTTEGSPRSGAPPAGPVVEMEFDRFG